jgi:murein L,D-transpeptidase YcbB/YkuD
MRFQPHLACAASWLLLAAIGLAAVAPSSPADPVAKRVEMLIARLGSASGITIAGEQVSSRGVLIDFYGARRFHPAWLEKRNIDDLLAAIRASEGDGLRPADYHLAALEALRQRADARDATPEVRGDLDVLASDALLRLGYHLYTGKVNPERIDPHWNISRRITGQAAAEWLTKATGPGAVRSALDRVRPSRRYYARLVQALATYRSIARRGGWPAIPEGPTLREGMRDPRVPFVRRRLAITGDYTGSATASDSTLFERPLTEAVKRFQYRAFLGDDGAVGPGTARAMSIPVGQRIDQIRVDLERARWVMHDLPSTRYVLVNVSSALVYFIDADTLAWRSRCQVGKVARKTPIFRSDMTYIVFNPTWTVPPSIFAKDILPAARRGEPVLQRKKLKVVDSKGRVINPSNVRWPANAKDFPYMLRQDPGPDNALGRVKLMFPNPYFVYLHDTPSKDLFEHSKRTFSSGCVRVEHPLQLAERVLADPARWSSGAIQKAVDAGETKNVTLTKPVPVLLLYWTVSIDDRGLVRFSDDVYSRDAPVLRTLNEPYRAGGSSKKI